MTGEHNHVNRKRFQSVNRLHELIYSGVLERFPKIKIVMEQRGYYFKQRGAKD